MEKKTQESRVDNVQYHTKHYVVRDRTHTDHENYWSQTFDMHTKERIAATAIFPFSYVPSSMFDVRTMLMIGLFIVGY